MDFFLLFCEGSVLKGSADYIYESRLIVSLCARLSAIVRVSVLLLFAKG